MNPKLLIIFYDNIHLSFLQKLTFRFIQQKQIYAAETKTDFFSRNKNGFIQPKQKRIYSAETKTDDIYFL